MTSLRARDGTVVDLGSFHERLFSDCESDVSYVEDAAAWSDTEYIADSADDDVNNDESFSLTDRNEQWIDISEESSASAIDSLFVNVQPFANPDVATQLNDDFTSRHTLGVADEVIVIEEGSPSHQSDSDVDVSYLSSENAETGVSHSEIPPANHVSPWQIEPNWHESSREHTTASETAHGDFHCTAVRIDENGFVHPIVQERDSGSDVEGSIVDVVQDGEDYIDVEGVCDTEDCRDGAFEVQLATSSNLDDDILNVTDWLFSIRQELLCDTSVLNMPQASYVGTVTVNSSGTMLHSQSSAVHPVPFESVSSGYDDIAVHGSSIGKQNETDSTSKC